MRSRFSSSPKPSGSSFAAESVGIALLGGTQITLTLLEKILDSFPLPFVKGLAGAGVEVIRMTRVIQSNKKECMELQQRSASLLVVVLDSLKSKGADEIPDELKQGVERLTNTFHEVIAELRIVEQRSSKGSLTKLSRSVLYHYDNAEALKGCTAKLDWAMQEFQVTSKVDSSLRDLKRHEELLHGQAQLQQGQAELLQGQAKILDAVKDKANDPMLSELPSTQLPANPRIFGRDGFVDSAVQLLLAKLNGHIVILGPGGIGKTSAALKIAHDPRVIERFEDYVLWVPCEQATSVFLLVELLAKALQLPASSSPDRLKEVIKILKSSRALVLMLDNFETPWDIPGKQSEVADILARLAQIPSVSLVLTMRGSQTPASDTIDWVEIPPLTKLELSPAREAFLRICPSASNDPQLDTLLGELDCVPLAITLMASLAKGRDTPSDLLSRWKTERTKMLSKPGGDRRNSIDTSIQLSLQSNLVKATPGAIDLLRILAKLPAGAKYARLPEICPSIPNWKDALSVLDNVALTCEWADKAWVRVLSPIRSYVQLYHPLEGIMLKELQQAYCNLAKKGDSGPGEAGFLDSVKDLAEEEMNLEPILIEMLGSSDHVEDIALKAAWDYTSYCYWTHPQTSVIRLAVEAAKKSSSRLLPMCMESLGDILRMQTQYDEAQRALEDARVLFVEYGSKLGAAQCLQSIGSILRLQSKDEEAISAFEDARHMFEEIGNQLKATQCLQSLGNILRMQSKNEEAKKVLEDARAIFTQIGDQLGAGQCLQSLSDMLHMQGNYEEAKSSLEDAKAIFIKIGSLLGVTQCQRSLGNILRMQGKYDKAKSALEDARVMFLKLGDQLGTIQCLQSLGEISFSEGKDEEAKSAINDARAMYAKLGDPLGVAQCSRTLGNILYMEDKYDEAQTVLEGAGVMFMEVKNQVGTAQCLQLLGNVLHMQGKYDEAISKLEEARSIYVNIHDQLGVAQCLRSLGNALCMQSKNDEARSALDNAKTMFIKLGDQQGAAQCLLRLSDVLRMEHKYDEAELNLEEARAIFIKLGSQMGTAVCLQSLGQILWLEDKNDEAKKLLEDARALFLELGDQFRAAQCLLLIGKVLYTQEKFEEARSILEHVRDIFDKLGLVTYVDDCSNLLQTIPSA
ncbi:hypothetical protein FRC03_001965 [Tulasnella sp. 419]|nr:hypothetical protein FRC03_001965 [Tulasnella sp. 419]